MPRLIFENESKTVNGYDGGFSSVPDITRSMKRILSRCQRSKPGYSDSWAVGCNELDPVESYVVDGADIIIGNNADGQAEYSVMPHEYKFGSELNHIIFDTISSVRRSCDSDRMNVDKTIRKHLMQYSSALKSSDTDVSSLIPIIKRYTVGLGIFEVLLKDSRLEDIYVDAPCEKNRIHVTLNGIAGFNSHIRCKTNIVAGEREVRSLISLLKRESGLSFSESEPVLETDIPGCDARATIVGYPMSPEGNAVAIRKHSLRPWTLTRLVANGTMEPEAAGLLSFLVDSRCTFLISGARGAGKSSLLSAMMFEFPKSQRILTIEDTSELPSAKMRSMGYKVQSMLVDERMGDDIQKRSDEALRVSLRLGESAIIMGEVRGEEARTLYQSMRTGRAGSSIMGTIHGDSALSVYERVVHDMGIAPEAFMATDIIVTMGTKKPRGSIRQYRRLFEISMTGSRSGDFLQIPPECNMSDNSIFASPMFRRILSSTSLSMDDIREDIAARSEIRAFLAEMGKKHSEKYHDPEWVVFANEHISAMMVNGTFNRTEAVDSFKKWFGRYNGISF